MEVFEVGAVSHAPLTAPADSEKARRVANPSSIYRAALHMATIILLAFIGGVLGGAIWTFFWSRLGGAIEPHGITAITWPVITNLPNMLLIWLCYRIGIGRLKFDYYDASSFLIGLSIASWAFYYFLLPQGEGFRRMIYKLPWSFFQKESVLVVIWTVWLCLGGFLPLLIRRILVRKLSTKKVILLFIIQSSLVIVPTSLAVIIFVNRFPSEEYESARGL